MFLHVFKFQIHANQVKLKVLRYKEFVLRPGYQGCSPVCLSSHAGIESRLLLKLKDFCFQISLSNVIKCVQFKENLCPFRLFIKEIDTTAQLYKTMVVFVLALSFMFL